VPGGRFRQPTSDTPGDHEIFTRLIIACCLGFAACATDSPPVPKAAFIIVDGIAADVFESVATPNLDGIAAQGGYARAYVGGAVGEASESPTISAVSYNNLITGTWANKHNVWDNAIADPDYRYWDIFRIAKTYDPSLKTALFSTWTDNRTKLIGDGLAAAGGNKLDYYFDGLDLDTERFPVDDEGLYIRDIDTLVAADAARYIAENGPDLSWVYLQYTDDAAHFYGDGPQLSAAIQFMDQQVGLIWKSIQQRRRNHNENWLLIVTTDHGTISETGNDHGGQSERERTIWIVTNSDRTNARFNENPGIVDILPSIATHLGLTIPELVARELDGQSFID
jgi:predicted AlkP superfamily pyrophosphatase or phosphodiesterase